MFTNSEQSVAARRHSGAGLAACCLLLVLGACAGRTVTGVQGPPGGNPPGGVPAALLPALPKLPAPSAVKRPSKVIVNVINGAAFDATASQNTAVVAGTDASFAPTTTPGTAGLAYAVFALEPDVASVKPVLHLAWRLAPPAGACWVGLGNFTTNSWTWQQWTAGHDLALDLQTTNINSVTGVVPFTVLLTGTASAQLGRARIGANLPPQPQATLTATQGPAPIQLGIDASASVDPDGLIVKYEYDLDGDGVNDQVSTQPLVQWQQPTDGSYQCSVTMTDDDGAYGSYVLDYDTGYKHVWSPLSGPTNVQYTAVASSPTGGYFAYGYAVLPPGGTKLTLVLLKYKASGELDWVRALGNAAESNIAGGMVADPAGGAYVTGTMTVVSGGGTQLIAHYLADGTLDWQRSSDPAKTWLRSGVVLDSANNNVYVSTTRVISATLDDAALQCYSTGGQWDWTRSWSSGGTTYSSGQGVDGLGNAYLAIVFPVGGYTHSGVIEFDASGTQQAKADVSGAAYSLQANACCVNPAGDVALVGEYLDAAVVGPFAIVLHPGFSQDYGFYSPESNNEDFFAACKFSQLDGSLWACGQFADTTDIEGALAVFAPNGFNREAYRFDAPGGKANLAGVDLPQGGGILLAGNQSGSLVIDPTERDLNPLTYTLSVPATDAAVDNTAPLISTYPSTAVQGDTSGSTGGLVYKFYQPLT